MEKLIVIAGHGAGDPGAVGNGYQEAERVRVLAQKIKDFGGDAVILGDFSRDYYKDGGISKLELSKDDMIIELHMNSFHITSARGGHVIIWHEYEPDEYDKNLAEFISTILPGRSDTIVKRSDLANPRRAAQKGYNYRLLECGFISNAADLEIFNTRMDEIAKGILNAFGIAAVDPQPVIPVAPAPELPNQNVITVQLPTIRRGSKGKAVMIWQAIVGAKVDGDFGPDTEQKTYEMQTRLFPGQENERDKIVGPKTWARGLETV